MAEETKFTLKIGLIASLVAGIIAFFGTTLFNHHGRLTALEINYGHTTATLQRMEKTLDDIRADQMRRFYKYETSEGKK